MQTQKSVSWEEKDKVKSWGIDICYCWRLTINIDTAHTRM